MAAGSSRPRALFPVPWIVEAYLRAGLVRHFRTWWVTKHHDLFGTAARVPVPSRVLVGARDPVVPVRFARSVADALRGDLVVLPRAAYAVIFDAAERFKTAILSFLRETGQADAGSPPRVASPRR